ncbi:MAG TPA: hypothetical protein VK993_11190, partial [Chthoniobacterales bacterium]|nr:hypothetical protein [Chthoniobacterales bacterium]
SSVDYTLIPGLRPETREKLSAAKPANIGQAGRISGITPADLAIIAVWLGRAGVPNRGNTSILAAPKSKASASPC